MEVNEKALEAASVAAITILPNDVIGIFNRLGTSSRKNAVARIIQVYLEEEKSENGKI